MIVDDSFSRLTTGMIVNDSFWSVVFPENRRACLKRPPKVPRESETQSQLQKFVFIYIQDDNHVKENIEDQDNKEKISSQLAVCATAGELSSTITNFFGCLII